MRNDDSFATVVPHDETITQTLSITAPEAVNVMLAGDFTHWLDHPIPMVRQSGGVWTAEVHLPPGTYHYRFLIDGQWWDDFDYTLQVPTPSSSPELAWWKV